MRAIIGHGDHGDVFRSAGIEGVQLGSDRRPIPLTPQYRSPCSVDEDFAQVDVPSFANAERPRLASSRILPWHDTEPRSKVASLPKGVRQQLPLREFHPHQHLSGYTKRGWTKLAISCS